MECRAKMVLAGGFFIVVSLMAAPCRAIWWGAKTDSVWVSTPVALDGNDKKWHPGDGDDDSGITYAFANDGKNLYLMLFPHTKSAKDQLAGTYIQDFTIWVDTSAGKAKTFGLRLAAPASRYDRAPREISVVGIDTAAAVSADAEAADIKLGPVIEERGILEARVPLSLLGAALPEKITVGLETSAAKAEVPHSTKPAGARNDAGGSGGGTGMEPGMGGSGGGRHGGGGGGRHGGGGHKQAAQQEEDLTPLQVWIKVTLARPAKAAAK